MSPSTSNDGMTVLQTFAEAFRLNDASGNVLDHAEELLQRYEVTLRWRFIKRKRLIVQSGKDIESARSLLERSKELVAGLDQVLT